MTNDQMLAIFNANLGHSLNSALRAVWNAGWYEGKNITPTATSPDKSYDASKPAAVIKVKR